jgi:hypothetical protein
MRKVPLLVLFFMASLTLAAQGNDEPAFTGSHRSTTLSYGVSSLLNLGGYTKDGGNGKSFTAGPLSLSMNKALTEDISFHWGPSVMYYRYKYSYQYDGNTDAGTVSLLFGGLSMGLNYHFANTGKFDPYAGVSVGAGYYYDINGDDKNAYSLGGSVPLLYGAKFGVNMYTQSTRAWTFELGYDYLSYFKVGYTFVKSK